MFCEKCGVKNSDESTFCTACGAKLNGVEPVVSDTSVTVNSNNKNRKVGIIAVAAAAAATVVVVLVVVLIIALSGGRGYKDTVEKYVYAQFKPDAAAMIELLPEKVIEYGLEEVGYDEDEFDEYLEEVNEEMQEYRDFLEIYLGEDFTVSYEILIVEDVTGNDLDDLKEVYEDMDVKVSAAKTVEIKLTIKAGDNEETGNSVVSVIKVGRSWYLDVTRMDGLF